MASTETRLRVDSLFAAHGMRRTMRFETQLSHGLCSFVESGLAVALVDPFTAHEYRGDGTRFIPFEPTLRMVFTVLLPSHRRTGLLTQSFVQHVRQQAVRQLNPRDIVKS